MIPLPKLGLTTGSLKLVVGIVCALLLALLIHDRSRWKAKAAHHAELLSAERGAHAATVANYRAAAERARREDASNVARVRADQNGINERIANDLESRIAAARAAAMRLRGKAGAAADSGSGGKPPVPGLPAAAESASQAAGANGLSAAERLTATEQAIQLDELIHWVREQAEVDVSGRSGR